MLCKFKVAKVSAKHSRNLLQSRCRFNTSSLNVEKSEDQHNSLEETSSDAQCWKKRDKSALLPQHRNVLWETIPYNQQFSWIHQTEKFQRKMLGRYGFASGVNSRICFSVKREFENSLLVEKVAEPHSFHEVMLQIRNNQQQQVDKIKKREIELTVKLEKLEQWKNELNAKILKKESDMLAAKERKDRLIEEVRRHFGFKVDPREERFKELLEQKEREDKKKMRETKRKIKEEKMMAKLIENNV